MAGTSFIILFLLLGPPGEASTAPHGIKNQIAAPTDELLATCREGILDPQARPEERRRWVQLLFSYEAKSANGLIVELLTLSARPDVQRAVCVELAARGRSDPDRLDVSFIEPLIQLLSVPGEELRSSAAKALAEFSDPGVVGKLGALAASRGAPMPARLAAVAALTPNTHRREVVEQLVNLVGPESPEVSEKVVAALEPIGPAGFGADPAGWREWWQKKKDMGQEAWLAEQVRLYRDRTRRLSTDLSTLRTERDREQTVVTARIRDLQRDALRGLPPEQRDAELVAWLDDSLSAVKLGALGLVKARIADEGKRPEGDVLAALLRAVAHESPIIRRESLMIVQNLQDRGVIDAVLAQLERESDLSTRLALLDSLGKMGDLTAVPALVREIAATEADPSRVRDAARALAQIAARWENKADLASAADPLRMRYRGVPSDHVELRAALLTAMAGVADPSCADDFAASLDADEPTLLQPAVTGSAALRDRSKLSRIRVLTGHLDPRVRLAAIDAVMALGGDDSTLDILHARLSPASESNELVRQAAWKGWREFVSKRPVAERIRAAERLREFPELETSYLAELATALAGTGNHKAALQDVRQRLVGALTASGKHAEAVPYLRDLYEAAAARSDPQAWSIGLRWLDAVLQTPNQQGLAELIVRLSHTASDDDQRAKVVEAVRTYIDSPAIGSDPERARRLSADLATVDAATVGDGWKDLIATLDSRLKAASVSPSG